MTFPACCQHIPEGRQRILVPVRPLRLNSICLTCWDASFTYTNYYWEPQLHCSPSADKRVRGKASERRGEVRGGNSWGFFFEFRQNPHPGLGLEQPWDPAVHRMLQMAAWAGSPPPSLTVLWGMQGPGTSPSLPFQTSSPNPYWVKKKKEREREEKKKKYARPWKHFCSSDFLVESWINLFISDIRIEIYNFAGISLMSWINFTSSLKYHTIWVEL